MATSTIRIYRTVLTPARNALVDDLDAYLGTTDLTYEDTTFQYQKLGLDINVKILFSQSAISNHDLGNYAVIAQDGKKWYYFIMNTEWKGVSTVNLKLSLDTINTFRNDLTFTEKTMIRRQHKDRFTTLKPLLNITNSWLDDAEWDWGTAAGEIIGKAQFQLPSTFIGRDFTSTITLIQGQGADVYDIEYDKDFAVVYVTAYVQGELSPIPRGKISIRTSSSVPTENYLVRKIDEQSEGFETVLWKTGSIDVLDSNDYQNNSYYLIYKTNNAFDSANPDAFIYNNAVNCFLTADEPIERNVYSDIEIKATDLATYEKLFIVFPTGADGKKLPNSFSNDIPDPKAGTVINCQAIRDDDSIANFSLKVIQVNDKRNKQQAVVFLKDSSGHLVVYPTALKRDNFVDSDYQLGSFKKIVIKDVGRVTCYKTTGDTGINKNWYDLLVRKSAGSRSFAATVLSTNQTKPFRDVSTNDAKILKIIKLPYAPTFNLQDYSWNNSEQLLQLNLKNNPYLLNEININMTEAGNFDQPVHQMFVSKPNITASDQRNNLYESKLYHSDFYNEKLVYDSFSYSFKLELLNTTNLVNNDLHFKVVTSTNVSSTFLFDFSSYFTLTKDTQDYNVMIVNRNLEAPVYNNYYMNYLRNGYNYDVKNKQSREVTTGIGTGLGIAQTVAGIALAASGYGSGVGAGLIVSGIATTAGSLTSAISGAVQADRSLQQKIEQAKNQAASVSGADDVGLLSYYAGNGKNKASLNRYEVSDNVKSKIADLFYYCGYKCDYQGEPNLISRYWFNFIQCTPVFREEGTSPYNDYIDDVKARYEAGVTVYHHHGQSIGWDFDQDRENWEKTLLN